MQYNYEIQACFFESEVFDIYLFPIPDNSCKMCILLWHANFFLINRTVRHFQHPKAAMIALYTFINPRSAMTRIIIFLETIGLFHMKSVSWILFCKYISYDHSTRSFTLSWVISHIPWWPITSEDRRLWRLIHYIFKTR